MDSVAGRARSDDLTRLRNRVIKYANPGDQADHLDVKSHRGFHHDLTGRLLCPVSKLAEFDADPEGCVANNHLLLCLRTMLTIEQVPPRRPQ